MNLRTKITLVSVLGILLVSVGLLTSSSISQQQTEDRFAQATKLGKSVLWNKIVNSQVDAMKNGIPSLARDSKTRKALKAGDHASLSESAKTTFNLLSASGIVDELILVDTNTNIAFSAPQPTSGKTNNPLIQKANSSGKIESGIVRDDNGSLKAMVAFPLTVRGKPVGMGIFSRTLNDAINDFKLNDKSDIQILSKSAEIEYTTNNENINNLDIQLPKLGESLLTESHSNDKVYSVVTLPIYDTTGKATAHLASIKDFTESYQKQKTFTLFTYIATAAIIIVVLIMIYWYMNRSLKPLESAVEILNEIAEGDLTAEITVSSNDEIGLLQTAMKSTVEHLRHMIVQVNDMTDQLGISSENMFQITDTTRMGIEQQRSEVEQVATAMNEMTATVQEVARHASQAAEAAGSADDEAKKGKEVVSKTIHSINSLANEIENATDVIFKLQENSNSIGSILDVIRGIAEQTNLLALNAAIEAARAGEQGRGFAVVADEVRTLASRTQQSTEEIQAMIQILQTGAEEAVNVMEASRNNANENVQYAAEAGESLGIITNSVDTITQMNLQIASASDEQSTVAEEINRNVVNINEVADRSADAAQKTSLASEELQSLSSDLRKLVSRFKV